MPNQPWRGAELDPNGCLPLSTILRSFSAPITEEQAWAIAYQALKCLQNCLNSCHQLLLTSDPAHLLIHSEGFVHHLTFQQPKQQIRPSTAARGTHLFSWNRYFIVVSSFL